MPAILCCCSDDCDRGGIPLGPLRRQLAQDPSIVQENPVPGRQIPAIPEVLLL